MNKRNLKQLEELPSTSKKSDPKSLTLILAIVKTLTLWTIETNFLAKSSLKQ